MWVTEKNTYLVTMASISLTPFPNLQFNFISMLFKTHFNLKISCNTNKDISTNKRV